MAEPRYTLEQREHLVEEYTQHWGPPPMFCLGTDDEAFDRIADALRTNKQIRIRVPKGSVL